MFPLQGSLNADIEDDLLDRIIHDDTISGRAFEPVMHTMSSHETNIGEPMFETRAPVIVPADSKTNLLNIKLLSPKNP